jgi:putative restriction endonuclease
MNRSAITSAAAIEALYRLNTGVIGVDESRHERPHKPALLLAVFDALASGKARPDHVPWSQWLRDRFGVLFELVKSRNDECSPENPFFYLRSDGFWQPVTVTAKGEVPLSATPVARDLDTGRVFARFVEGWDALVADPVRRMAFRDAIVARYFPSARAKIAACFVEPSMGSVAVEPAVAEEAEEILPGRSSAFRRRVLEIYDFQCVACGLRIWMPEHELSFVDAAHLVPFSHTRNDHPTNGLALCKNHHWALDQRLIAPDADAVWRVSRYIEPRRSRGEDELARLAGQPVLPPAERAFAPDRTGLEWRFARLLN